MQRCMLRGLYRIKCVWTNQERVSDFTPSQHSIDTSPVAGQYVVQYAVLPRYHVSLLGRRLDIERTFS